MCENPPGWCLQTFLGGEVVESYRLLSGDGAGNGEAQTAFGTTAGEHLAAIGGGHAGTEAVLVNSLAVRRLERSFHCRICLIF